MIELIIFLFTIFLGLGATISYLNNSAKLQLCDIDTTEKRILYRKQIYKKRIKTILAVVSVPILTLVYLMIQICFIPSPIDDNKDLKMWLEISCYIMFSILIICGPLTIIMYIQYKGNLSYFDMKTFLEKNNSFILYLRGFEKDDYSNKMRLYRIRNMQFSEYLFTKILSKKCVCAAVGMTRELDAPLGAKRIYVDDETWKNDVAELMEKSFQIYILIHYCPVKVD